MWVVVDLARGAERAPGAKADGTTGRPCHPADATLGSSVVLGRITVVGLPIGGRGDPPGSGNGLASAGSDGGAVD